MAMSSGARGRGCAAPTLHCAHHEGSATPWPSALSPQPYPDGPPERPPALRCRRRAPPVALDCRHARRGARDRDRRQPGTPAFARRLPQHHLSEQGADHRHRGTRLPRQPRLAPALGNRRKDRGLSADRAAGHQGPDRADRPARGRGRVEHAALAKPQARPRVADLSAVPARAQPCATGHPAWRADGGLLDRRADHRRKWYRQERAGAGTDHARPSPGRRRRAPNSP